MHCAVQYSTQLCQITKDIICPRFCLFLIILDFNPCTMSALLSVTWGLKKSWLYLPSNFWDSWMGGDAYRASSIWTALRWLPTPQRYTPGDKGYYGFVHKSKCTTSLTHTSTPAYHEVRSCYWKGGLGYLVDVSSPRTEIGDQFYQVGWGYELIHRLARISRVRLACIVKNAPSRSGRGIMKKRGGDV